RKSRVSTAATSTYLQGRSETRNWCSDYAGGSVGDEGVRADALVFGFEGGGKAGVLDDQEVLVVIAIGAGREIERAEDGDTAILDDDLVVQIPGVGVQEDVEAGGLQLSVLREALAGLRALENAGHRDAGAGPLDHGVANPVLCEGEGQKVEPLPAGPDPTNHLRGGAVFGREVVFGASPGQRDDAVGDITAGFGAAELVADEHLLELGRVVGGQLLGLDDDGIVVVPPGLAEGV